MDLLSLPAFLSPPQLSSKPYKPPAAVRRPIIPPPPDLPKFAQTPLNKISKNQLKPLPNSPTPLNDKLFLSSKLIPPPPPPQPEPESKPEPEPEPYTPPTPAASRFVQREKIFVGNLPLWIKKNEIAEFFRQFGPLKNVILIKGHDSPERNVGYCFVIFGGPTGEEAAVRAVEADGVEFHGKVLTIRFDDGERLRKREEERQRWVKGETDGKVFESKWHEERDGARGNFRKVLESRPENWQAVIRAFERIPKV